MNSEILRLLKLSTMTIATVGADGQPHAAAVYFVADEIAFLTKLNPHISSQNSTEPSLSIFFFSDPASQHSQDFSFNPRAAVTIYPEVIEWRKIQGLQMRGIVQMIPKGTLWEYGWSLYQQKFPFVITLKPIVRRNTFYRFIPQWLRWLDNRQKLGFKKEWQFA